MGVVLHAYLNINLRIAESTVETVLILLWNPTMDNLHYRLIFDLDKSRRKNEIPGKNLSVGGKFQNMVAKSCKKTENIALQSSKFSYYCVTCGNCYHNFFEPKVVTISARDTIIQLQTL